MDEFLLAPFFNGGYLSYAALVGGDSVSDSLSENFWDVMFADWLVWPSVMVVCFLKVPVQFRPAYVAFVGVGWNTFLAYKAHSELTEVLLDSDTVLGRQVFPNEATPPVEPPTGVLKESSSSSSSSRLPLKMIRRTTTARHRSGNIDSASTGT